VVKSGNLAANAERTPPHEDFLKHETVRSHLCSGTLRDQFAIGV